MSTHYTCLFDYTNHVSKSQHLGSRYSILSSSNLGRFVRNFCNDAWDYRRTAAKLFLAQRVAFGVIDVIVFTDVHFRMLLIVGTPPPPPFLIGPLDLRSVIFILDGNGRISCNVDAGERGIFLGVCQGLELRRNNHGAADCNILVLT